MRISLLVAAAIAAAAPALADDIDDAIQARQGFYRMLAIEIGPLGKMAKGEIEYDAATAAHNAADMKALSGYDFPSLFVEGSSKTEQPGETRALMAIWENSDDFVTKADQLVRAISELQAVAGDGREAMAPAVGAVGKACGACHDDYRAEEF